MEKLPIEVESLLAKMSVLEREVAERQIQLRSLRAELRRHTEATTTALSQRELEILPLLKLSNKEIAAQLNLSVRGVQFHVSNLLTKFDVERRQDIPV